mmetsp:Transcript_35517/g.65230  ORF Transcript_35517/g.65230 Transcript_35517/m.65230 type:complete len:207 (-) Transcript_35517:547-1167(-)
MESWTSSGCSGWPRSKCPPSPRGMSPVGPRCSGACCAGSTDRGSGAAVSASGASGASGTSGASPPPSKFSRVFMKSCSIAAFSSPQAFRLSGSMMVWKVSGSCIICAMSGFSSRIFRRASFSSIASSRFWPDSSMRSISSATSGSIMYSSSSSSPSPSPSPSPRASSVADGRKILKPFWTSFTGDMRDMAIPTYPLILAACWRRFI